MKTALWRKGAGVGVALSLVLLIFMVLIPSATAVKVSAGAPSNFSVNAGSTIFFQNVNLTIRAAEVIPVNFLTFEIFNSTTDHRVAWVRFTLMGAEMSENPPGTFTVMNVTDTSDLPYQSKGHYYGYDERTGYNVTRFHHGYGYGYGYGNPDLMIVYNITYKTCKPGTYYAKLFVKATKHTYTSGETPIFTVLPRPPLSISVDIKPGCWPNHINPRDHGYLQIAICGTHTFDVHTIDPKSLTLALNGGKNRVKCLCWSYQDVTTPGTGSKGGGHKAKGDGCLDLVLKFRCDQVIQVLKLFKHPGETLRLTLTGTLKKTLDCSPVIGHDYVQMTKSCKK
jgi:hypothetical protein